MEPINLPSGEDFEDYCLRTFECFLQGDLFPYSLKETFDLVFASWNEAVNELLEHGVEGFSYQKSLDADDYQLCMEGFTQHVLLQDRTLRLLVCFCNTTYKQLVSTFDIPMRYDTKSVMGDNGRMKIVHVPINGHQPKVQNPRYSGVMEANGDLVAKVSFDRFLQEAGFTVSTAEIAQAFGMPEEGLLCILNQNGIIRCKHSEVRDKIDDEEDDANSWELADNLSGNGYTLVKTGIDGMPEIQWTYKGIFFIWLLLTKDCDVRPCYERKEEE